MESPPFVHGIASFLDKLEKRKFFAAGMALFVLGLCALSQIVWHVNVEGNGKIAAEQVLDAAREQGIYPLQWKFRLKDPDVLSKQLQSKLPGTAWVGVQIHGTNITIKVVEATEPEKKPLVSPRNLVASENALITRIYAEKGKPIAKANTYVKKGDVLISGIVGSGGNYRVVAAEGTVKGIVWEEAEIEVPLKRTYKVYTGQYKDKSYLVIGSRALQLTGYGKTAFDRYETKAERKSLQWRNYIVPVGWLKERVMEVRYEEQSIGREEAKQSALEQAKADILSKAGEDAEVKSRIILQEKSESGKVYMKALFEVEKRITEEQPIVEQPKQQGE